MESYNTEIIEYVTELTIEKEIRNDIKNALDYIAKEKEILSSKVYNNDSFITAANEIKDDVDAIAENTIADIKLNIMKTIADKGYVMKITDDGNGNADIVFVKGASE